MNNLTFIFNIEPYIFKYKIKNELNIEKDSETMCLIMLESLRELSKDCAIIGISANGNIPSENFLNNIKKLNVDFYFNKIDEKPFNGYFNKINAYHFLKSKINTNYVCFLDVDVIFLKNINLNKIFLELEYNDLVSYLGYEPKPYLPDGFKLDERKKYKRHFSSKEQEDYMKKFNIRYDNLFPSGIIFSKNDNNLETILNKWKKNSIDITSDGNVLALYNNKEFEYNTLTDEDIMSSFIDEYKTITINDDSLIHYHLFYNLVPCFKEIGIQKNIRDILIKHNYNYLNEI